MGATRQIKPYTFRPYLSSAILMLSLFILIQILAMCIFFPLITSENFSISQLDPVHVFLILIFLALDITCVVFLIHARIRFTINEDGISASKGEQQVVPFTSWDNYCCIYLIQIVHENSHYNDTGAARYMIISPKPLSSSELKVIAKRIRGRLPDIITEGCITALLQPDMIGSVKRTVCNRIPVVEEMVLFEEFE